MTRSIRVLVTGATGRLGAYVCRALLERGHEVKATDLRFSADFPVFVQVGDLKDEFFAYRMLEGCEALVHLGNHPNAWCGPSRQRILAENAAMNANVFFAATDLNVRRIVFSSSIQVVLKSSGGHGERPFAVPYLPLDSLAPAAPGINAYALSKEHGERLLGLLCERYPDLSATALRLPMLPTPLWLERVATPLPRTMLNWADCLTYLTLEDAAQLIALALERSLPGYHQYLPANTLRIQGYSLARIVREQYAHVLLRQDPEALTNFADVSLLQEELGWEPSEPITVQLQETLGPAAAEHRDG